MSPLNSSPKSRRTPSRLVRAAIVAATIATSVIGAGPAVAQSSSSLPGSASPQPWLGDAPYIVSSNQVDGNYWRVDVWSPANRVVISNNVLLPGHGGPRPSLYLLPGLQGGQAGMNWMSHSDVKNWALDKNVNVVMPLGGPYSLYTDWDFNDPILGVNKWNTYMTSELPPLIDQAFNGTGRDAIGGISSTGAAALDIAAHAPWRYAAAASYSGCPIRSGAFGGLVSSSMMVAGGGSAFNAWGLPGSPSWADHDPGANPGRLRDVKVFVSSASGTPGAIDGTNDPSMWLGPRAVELVATECTNQYTNIARGAGVDVNRQFYPEGAHSFGLFFQEMKDSWDQTIRWAIGA
ncbi:alpha/beta hydrolase [Corynebacterium vitaeruminis]|uniref:Esterase n=1 Tax=Corynebacterium vitaeruminis DSM 20294 TaxID=1224164 RepID=W5Y0S1_9CORY|nr:alpha/beta hydrolase-fold protein [Corynebacterium vitaeruminis]AHI22817.1 esterase [Corynebacterium vitaeruminis DSM 20294]